MKQMGCLVVLSWFLLNNETNETEKEKGKRKGNEEGKKRKRKGKWIFLSLMFILLLFFRFWGKRQLKPLSAAGSGRKLHSHYICPVEKVAFNKPLPTLFYLQL